MKGTIVYIAHGALRFHQQTAFSIYSLLHWLMQEEDSAVRVAVFTDKPHRVPSHELIQTHKLTSSELVQFKGALNYVHRVKIAVLAEAAEIYPGPILYVDCDTKWLRSPRTAWVLPRYHGRLS